MPTFFTDTYTATLDLFDLIPWWAHWLSGLFAVLGVALKFRALLAFIPVAGPVLLLVANAAVGFLGFIARTVLVPYLKQVGFGAYKAATTLHGIAITTFAVPLLIIFGIVIGVKLTAYLVVEEKAVTEERTMERDDARKERDIALAELSHWKGRFDAEQDDTSKARQERDDAIARVKAEEEARKRAVAANARALRLRDGAGPGAPAKGTGSKDAPQTGLLGLPALPWLAQ